MVRVWKARLAATIGQGESASRHFFLPHRLLLFRVLFFLPVVRAAHIFMREGHADEPPLFEFEARGAGPVLVFLLVLLVAEDVGHRFFLFLLVLLLGLAGLGGHRPRAAIVIG